MSYLILRNVVTKNPKINFLNATKIILMYTCVILIVNISLFAQTPEELMQQGNKFYQTGQYETAIEAYQKILSQGYESYALYYNLGNAYFKAGKLGYAILNYEKGLKISPGDEDLSYNLKIANARTVDKITELPKLFILQWWDLLITTFSVPGWSLIVIFLYLIFLISIGLYLLSGRLRIQRLSFLTGSASLAVLIISVVILISRYDHEATTNYGILLEPAYSVKIAPDIKSNDAFVIHEGIKFTVEDHLSDWYKIRMVDGKVGWIQKNSFGQI